MLLGCWFAAIVATAVGQVAESLYAYLSDGRSGWLVATLAGVVVLLAWRTRWRWPVLLLAVPFVLLVGGSRVYLGVHFPSDILAGWAAASIWAAIVYLAVFRWRMHPWRTGR